jgi:diamine N-acetyltransferase
MNVRLATHADAGILAGLNWDVQKLHADARPAVFKQPSDLSAIGEDLCVRFIEKPDACIFLVEDNDEAVGYAAVNVSRRPETLYTYARSAVHIDQIAVNPARQGCGYGRALIEAVLNLARAEQITRVTLETWDFNVDAQAFFKKMGFHAYHYRMDLTLENI